MLLKEALQETYADWKGDLSSEWRNVFKDVEPAFDKVDSKLELEAWEPIFPALKGKRILGSPFGASTLSAFEKLTPNTVRVILIGQDPYPNIAQATGRAFEQGNVDDWAQDSHNVTKSMRRILQVLGDFRSSTTNYTSQDLLGWNKLVEDISAKTVQIENRHKLFDKWADQGVLLLNAGLSITRFAKGGDPHQLKGHIPLWKPVIDAVLRYFAQNNAEPTLFVLWGDKALDIFRDARVEQIAKTASKWQTAVRFVYRNHPAHDADEGEVPFFQEKNAFVELNAELITMGTAAIDW